MIKIETIPQKISAALKKAVIDKDFSQAVNLLRSLSHCNLILLNTSIQKLLADSTITNVEFKLRLQLFISEQKLNEQKIEEANTLIDEILLQSPAVELQEINVLANLQLAVVYMYKNKSTQSIKLLQKCKGIAKKINNPLLQIETFIYGYHFYSESDLPKAGAFIFEAFNIAHLLNHHYWQAYCFMHLGTLNTILNNNEVAINYLNEAFSIFKALNLNLSMADNLMCQFNIYYRQKDFEKAITSLQQAIELTPHCGWDHKVAICYGNLSTVYLQLNNYQAAKQAAEKDIELSLQLNNTYNVGTATFRLGKIEAALGNTAHAIQLFNNSIEIRKSSITNTQLAHVYQQLFPLYAQVGQFENAYQTQANFMRLKFDILDAEKAKENEAQRAKYEADKREAELKEARLLQTESELKALKAQMNPHFIFNALNSIQEIFFLGDKRLANKHLSRFSQLMRSILKASGKKTITLQEEITMLQEYLTLEGLRFGDNFLFEIVVDENVDTYTLDVPPMILQPFVENAVKHGLLHKEGEQKIKLHFSFKEDSNVVIVSISDNGIGRKASALINKHRQQHDSFSTSATEKRFEILNQFTTVPFSFNYQDLEDSEGNSLGTKVQLVLPTE